MKKVLALMFAVTILFAACSKEKKLNRKLDGDWNVVTLNSVALSVTNATAVLSFNKDKKEGTYTFTFTNVVAGISVVRKEAGTYTLTEDEAINLTPTTSGGTDGILTVLSYSKTAMTLKNESGELYALEKM